VHLVDFIIRIYHDSRFCECQVQRHILLTNQPQPQTFRESIRRSAANVWSRPVIILKYTNIKFPLAMNSLRKEEERNPEAVEFWRFILDVLTDDVTAHVASIVRDDFERMWAKESLSNLNLIIPESAWWN